MKKGLLFAGVVLAGLGASFVGKSLAEAPATQPTRYRVVLQVNVAGDEQYDELLRNVENLGKAIGTDNLEVEIITHGKGLGLLTTKNEQIQERLAALSKKGTQISACSNTCTAKKISPSDLAPYVKIVDSGVAEVVKREAEGWAYLKAGS